MSPTVMYSGSAEYALIGVALEDAVSAILASALCFVVIVIPLAALPVKMQLLYLAFAAMSICDVHHVFQSKEQTIYERRPKASSPSTGKG